MARLGGNIVNIESKIYSVNGISKGNTIKKTNTKKDGTVALEGMFTSIKTTETETGYRNADRNVQEVSATNVTAANGKIYAKQYEAHLNREQTQRILKDALEESFTQEMTAYLSDEELNAMYPPSDALLKRIGEINAEGS